MKEHPIIFSAPMVRAILEGRKTMTRRLVKGSTEHRGPYNPAYLECHRNDPGWATICPYGQPGDRLWVREGLTYVKSDPLTAEKYSDGTGPHCYSASIPKGHDSADPFGDFYLFGLTETPPLPARNISPIHMPRWASRIDLEITEVRVQRVQEITEADAEDEGVDPWHDLAGTGATVAERCFGYRVAFEKLWDAIHGPGAWERNEWVWVISFKRVRP